MAQEKTVLNRIQLFASSIGARLFRNNVGLAYTGKVISKTFDTVTLKNPRPIKYGLCLGSGDLIGGSQIIITPNMVGRKVFVFTNYEVKTNNTKTSNEQVAFHNMVMSLGGISMIERFDSDSIEGNKLRATIDQFQGTI